jgi:hypothetical protein
MQGANVSLAVNQTVSLIEDPVPGTNRIFFSGQAHDTSLLTPIFGTQFHMNSPGPSYNFANIPQTNYAMGGHIWTHKASIMATSGSNNTSNHDKDAYTAFHRSLDPVNYPARKMWYTVNGRVVMGFTNTDQGDQNGVDSSQFNYIYPGDITQGYLLAPTAGVQYSNQFFYEDPANNLLWGIGTACPLFPGINIARNYDNPVTFSSSRLIRNDYATPHFLGVDAANNTVWVSNHFAAGDPYYIFKYMVGNTNNSPILQNLIGTTNNQAAPTGGLTALGTSIYNARPSNVRYDNSSTRVFYSAQFDGNGELRPIRFVWDPTNTTAITYNNPGSCITATTCTMVYAIGTYSNYARPCTIAAQSAYNADNWHYQGWQFRPSSTTTWYISFWPSDKTTITYTAGSGPNNSTLRWTNPLQRTMVTYSINTLTDTYSTATLTYHSSFTFPGVVDIPKDWLPITGDGTMMAVPVTGKVNFMTFNPIQGWGLTNTYPYEMRTLGLDTQNRLWGVGSEMGNFSVHLITPTAPYTVSVIMPTQNITYVGTNILTTATMYAYDSNGNQVSITTNLTINGSTMLFTDNGTIAQTFVTSATSATNINLTITGGGVNNIVVGATI